MSDGNNGMFDETLRGMFGPTLEELERLRRRYGVPAAEAPSPIVSIGRGAMDAWEPVKQAYLNAFQPDQAAAYRAQRAEDERLYLRGLLAGNPRPNAKAGPPIGDPWRDAGHQLVAAPLMLPLSAMRLPEAMMSYGLTADAGEALNVLRKRLGLGE